MLMGVSVVASCVVMTACTRTQTYRPYLPELKRIRLETFIPGMKFQHKYADSECGPERRSALDKALERQNAGRAPETGVPYMRLDFDSVTSEIPKWEGIFRESAKSKGFVEDLPQADSIYRSVELHRPPRNKNEPEVTVRLVWALQPIGGRTDGYLDLFTGCDALRN
jgi:hypothetical protein